MRPLARASLRKLRSGIVPLDDIEQLSVGYEDIERVVAESLARLRSDGHGEPTFVTGEWGTGKSHLLEYVRAVATREGVAHVRVELDARNAPLNLPQRFYPWIVDSVRLNSNRGLRAILDDAFADPARKTGLLRFLSTQSAGTLGTPLRSIVAASNACGSDRLVDHPAWDIVTGVDLAPYDQKRSKALERLSAFAKLLRAISGTGVALVMDEAETIDQLWNKLSRMGAYETLEALCAMDSAWVLFGVTYRFDRVIGRDLETAFFRQATNGGAARFLARWHSGPRKIRPPALTDDIARELTAKVAAAYRAAYPGAMDANQQALSVFANWRLNPSRNPRRLIRAVIDKLDLSRDVSQVSAALIG